MKLIIETANNGYILSYQETLETEEENNEKEETKYIVVEDKDGNNSTVETRTTQSLLWAVMEYFNLFGSKHDTERVSVIRRDINGKEIED